MMILFMIINIAIQEVVSINMIKGDNSVIKVIKRIFGYRNFAKFRTHILLIDNSLLPSLT